MRHAILPSMCAVAVAASCSPTLAQQVAPAAAASPAYLNTERGLRVKTLEGREISPSLMNAPGRTNHQKDARRSHQAQRNASA